MKAKHTFSKKVWKKRSKYASVIISVVISFLFVSMGVYGATTVSTNLSTGGTLAVTGLSTLTGGFISAASSTVSSTLTVTGNLVASTTFGVTGTSSLYGVLTVGATSTPAIGEVGIVGDVAQSTSGTTTLILDSSTSGRGGCIQLKGSNNTWFRIYATSSAGYAYLEAGGCQSAN